MAYEIAGQDYSFPAAADLSGNQYYFVEIGATGVTVCDAATDIPLGVLQNKPGSGAAAAVRVTGISKVIAGGAISVGNPVGTDASGRARALTPGTDTTAYIRGIALEAASAANEIISVLLLPVARAA